MTRSRGMRAAFVLRRMRYNRLLLACILAAILIITGLVTVLANFAARALPAAAAQQLASASTTILANSTVNQPRPGATDRLIASSVRGALGGVSFGMQRAVWSDPLDLPSPADGSSIWSAQVASMVSITAHARVVAGNWPAPPQPGQPVGVAIPVADARPLRMAVGQTLNLTDGDNQRLVVLRVTGLYEATDPTSGYWGLDLLSSSGISVQPGFRTFGPFIAQPGALGDGQLTASEVSWLVTPSLAHIEPGQMPGMAARLRPALDRMNQAQVQTTTSLPQLLTGIATSYDVSRSLLLISALELLLVAAAALALTARLLASQRTEEGALLEARGLTRRQLTVLSLAEGLLLVVMAAAAGAVAGNWAAGPVESAGILRADRQRLVGAGAAAWWPAVVVAVLALLILAWPAVVPGAASTVSARKGRQPAVAMVTRAGADVAVIALAVVTGWQLRRYSVVARSASGSIGIDPVLIAAPPLILIGAALIPLRLVPALARLGDRIAVRGRRLVAALATWEISRRPVRQAGPALLAILAVGTGTLALAQQRSWTESVHAQAAAAVGADVRVNLPPSASLANPAAVLGAHAVKAAMPVSVFDGGLSGQVVAIDSQTAARVVLLRPDQASQPASTLWHMIRPSPRRAGFAIPGHPYRLAVLTRMSAAPRAWDFGPLAVTLSIQAADGVGYEVPAGVLRADGRSQVLAADVPAVARASSPLRILGMTIGYLLPGFPPGPFPSAAAARAAEAARARHQVTLTVVGFAAAAGPAGAFPAPFASGAALDSWQRGASSVFLASDPGASGTQPAILGWRPAAGSGRAMTFRPGYGHLVQKAGHPPVQVSGALTLAVPARAAPLAAIATSSFLASSNDVVGAAVKVAAGNANIPVTIVAVIKSFPTAGPTGALIIDQDSVQAALAARSAPPLPVTSWWLSTVKGQVPPGIPASQVTSLREEIAQMQANLLAAAPQRVVLGLIIAVALLALLGFSVSVAASLSERRARSALLAALGVTRAAQARQLCLEQLLLALPAAAVGLLVGTGIAHLLVPAVTITERATLPVPPPLVYVPAGWAITLAALVAVIPVLAAAVTIARKPDPAAELRAAGTT
jgi:ABC-type antimicrobial peptide transport system permease subunit